MVKISYYDNFLIVDVSDMPELFNGQYSMIFKDQGFIKSENTNRYVMDNPIKIQSTVSQLQAFFKRKKIEFTFDESYSNLYAKIDNEKTMFEYALQNGRNIEEQSVSAFEIERFKRTLKPYQVKAVNHMLAVNHSANFSVPGSGKTTMIYATYAKWLQDGIIEKIMVIGPVSSFMAWEEEYEGCFHTKVKNVRLLGPNRDIKYNRADDYELFLTTFQTAALDIEKIINILKKYKTLLIIDESHYIKKFENGTWANALLNIAPYAERRIISTGTPMPNGPLDLYTQFTFLWPTKVLFGDQNKYKSDLKRNNEQLEWLQNKINPLFYRVSKSDLELPPYKINRVDVPMSKYQREIYDLIAAQTVEEYENLSSYEISELGRFRKSRLIRLMQISSNPKLLNKVDEEFKLPPLHVEDLDVVNLITNYHKYEKPNKLIKLIELAENLINKGEKVLIWSNFIDNIFEIKKGFIKLGIPTYIIYGGVPKSDEEDEEFNREQQIRLFKTSKEPCVLIANPAACAESISLHKDCHHAIYFDRNFNCGHYLQSLDRIHRVGLDPDQDTTYYFLESTNSIDEIIHQRLEEKAWTMRQIIDNELPIGDVLEDEWQDTQQLKKDFESVINHIKGHSL